MGFALRGRLFCAEPGKFQLFSAAQLALHLKLTKLSGGYSILLGSISHLWASFWAKPKHGPPADLDPMVLLPICFFFPCRRELTAALLPEHLHSSLGTEPASFHVLEALTCIKGLQEGCCPVKFLNVFHAHRKRNCKDMKKYKRKKRIITSISDVLCETREP